MPYLNNVRTPYDKLVGSSTLPASNGSPVHKNLLKADRKQTDAVKAIVRNMKMKSSYTPDLFEDPVLHRQWVLLLAKALERYDEIDPEDDPTLPDLEKFDKRLKQISANFNNLFQSGYVAPKVSTPPPHPENNLHVVNAAKTGNFDNITVVMLRNYLASVGMSDVHRKRKTELIKIVKNSV